MIIEITRTNKDDIKKIDSIVGTTFSLLQKLKLKGVGSKRMIIEEVSPNLKYFMNSVADITYGSIELRTNGILVHIHKGLRRFVWALPYYQLYLYKTPSLSIHGQGRFVLFKNSKTHLENKVFIERLIALKKEFDKNHPQIDAI